MPDKSLHNNRGYLLVEAVVAITILIIGFLGMLAILSNTNAISRTVNDQFVANYLAMEGIEIVKNIIDGNVMQGNPWNQNITDGDYEVDYQSPRLKASQGRYLLFNSVKSQYSYQNGTQSPFTRTIQITSISADEIRVNSVVKWIGRGGGKFEINLEDHFFNWR